MKKQKLIEVAGWLGLAFILLAYALVSFERIESASMVFQIMNAFGAIGIIISSLSKKDYQPAVLNFIWLFIALIALIR